MAGWRRSAVLLAVCAALSLGVACDGDGGGGAPPADTPTAVVATATLVPVGFLPRPTRVPLVPGSREGAFGRCPPLPVAACALPGERINPYRELSMGSAVYLRALYSTRDELYVLDSTDVNAVVSTLNIDVGVEAYTLDDPRRGDSRTFELSIGWSADSPPFPEAPWMSQLQVTVDLEANGMGQEVMGIQWAIPSEFGDLLLQHLSRQPPPTVTPSPTIVPASALYFAGHPEDQLRWEGPDGRVYTEASAHCGNPGLRQRFGVPAYLNVRDEIGFWSTYAVPREDGWRWTGYYHGEWQIWQGDDPEVVYLVYGPEPRIAFEYMSYGCE